MEQNSISVRFNPSQRNDILPGNNVQDLLIGLISSIKSGLFVDSLETGLTPEELHHLLATTPQLKKETAIIEMLSFLRDEGERTSYSILLPYLLTATDDEETERILRERFFGVELFIHRVKNLRRFLKYVDKKNKVDPKNIVSIGQEDLKRGILAWDMGELINWARIACETGYINEKTAWEHIKYAGEQCRQIFWNWEEIGKSYLIGQAMITDEKEEIDRVIKCFLLATQDANSPWRKNHHFSL